MTAIYSPASLGGFPMEIKTMILEEVPDIGALLALSSISRSFHEAYIVNRKRLLTGATLRQLGVLYGS